MAVPKKRTSKSKTRSRRSANNNLTPTRFQDCPQCGAPKRPHRTCMECGTYRGEDIIEVWEY